MDTRYSKIWLIDEPHRRAMYFLHSDGSMVLESAMDLKNPDRLVVPYTRSMLAGHLFIPFAKKALLLGLGGGSMFRTYAKFFPQVAVDAVELDPEVIEIAKTYFHLEPAVHAQIINQDARSYVESTTKTYDLIHIDAYLVKDPSTDSRGFPLNMKTEEFLKQLSHSLTPSGVLVFNLNSSDHLKEDVRLLVNSYRGVYRFSVPNRGNVVLIATNRKDLPGKTKLELTGRMLDLRSSGCGVSFYELAGLLKQYWIDGKQIKKSNQIDPSAFFDL